MTKLFVVAIVGIIAVVDTIFVFNGTQTISEFLYLSGREYPVVPLAIGMLVGHIFWPVKVSR